MISAVGDGETANEELYFCVDGGGTRSRGRLFNREGRVLADAEDGKPDVLSEIAKMKAPAVAASKE